MAPQMLAEADRGLPVDAAVWERGHMGGRVYRPADRGRIRGLPAGVRDFEHARPAGEGYPRAHLRSPGPGAPGAGPRRTIAWPARPAARLWRLRPGPTGTARRMPRPPGIAPTAP